MKAESDVKVTDGAELHLDPEDLSRLSSVFAAPRWLRDLGLAAWFLVAVFLLLAGLVWVLGETETIIGPVIAGTIVSVVASPIVAWLVRHRIPRAAGAAIVLLSLVAIAVGVFILVLKGITDQSDQLSKYAADAAAKAQSWLQGAGVDHSSAGSANDDVSSAVPQIVSTLAHGVLHGIEGITSLAFAVSFTALSIFFLLKDGPKMRASIEAHLGLPRPVARIITGDVITSLRGYFKGVTLVAIFNGLVVFIGALILDVPLAGTIGLVTFLMAYIPFVGAFVAGALAVIVALGSQGTTTALIMLVIVILANGLLQNVMQPFAMGAALQLNPLVVLVLTISAGCLFGMIGLVLAAPLASAAVHIASDLRAARAPVRAPS